MIRKGANVDFEFESYLALESHLNGQLKKGNEYGFKTCLQTALDAKQAINDAATHHQKMAAIARFGAEIKRWHKMLILQCTHIALRGREVSRTNVQHWQKSVFGRSISTNDLHMYADQTRSAGVKIPSLPSDDPASSEARNFYLKHQHRLKAKVSQKDIQSQTTNF